MKKSAASKWETPEDKWASENRQVVAAAIGDDRRSSCQGCPLLLAPAPGRASNAAGGRSDSQADCGAANASRFPRAEASGEQVSDADGLWAASDCHDVCCAAGGGLLRLRAPRRFSDEGQSRSEYLLDLKRRDKPASQQSRAMEAVLNHAAASPSLGTGGTPVSPAPTEGPGCSPE